MSGGARGGAGRKMVIVLFLIGGLVLLHRFGGRVETFDPSAMLALGFVLLASYAFGQLVGRIGLPHLTGYILAGLALGPSASEAIPELLELLPIGVRTLPPPFDHGVLSDSVIRQLRPLEILAVALIALTAGGELRVGLLRRGVGQIAGMIAGHLIVVGPIAFLFVGAVSGLVPTFAVPGVGEVDLRLPGLGELGVGGAIAMAVVVGAVIISTSPAATVAVVAETRSNGPVTGVVLAAVVLMDVVIVILFSIASTVAGRMLGQSARGDLAMYLLQHIGLSLVVGAFVGGVMILYLRLVKAELLLFLVAIVFTVTFLASQLDLEPVLLFIAAGFVTANFSDEGHHLLENVERLFLPVSVVFFTLAGARLHLGLLVGLAPFAITMVLLRAGGTFVGIRAALRVARAPDVVRRYAWVGFVPQAGVALSLAALVGRSFGELGVTFETLLVAGIALNELVGPVMLKVGLARAGEIGKADAPVAEPTATPSLVPPLADALPSDALGSWPAPVDEGDPWGPPLESDSPALDEAIGSLTRDVAKLAELEAERSFAPFRVGASEYVRELRREFLRHHRRITVQAREDATELTAAEALRLEQAELADKWRAAALARAARLRSDAGWSARSLVDAASARVDALPDRVSATYLPSAFEARPEDAWNVAAARSWLRIARALGVKRPRTVPLRSLARYHLWGRLPERLEPVVELHAQADVHLAARTRAILDRLVGEYDTLAADAEGNDDHAMLEARLREVREHVEAELAHAAAEIDRIADGLAARVSAAVGTCVRELKEDALIAGSPDLPLRARAPSTLYRRREDVLRSMARHTTAQREASAAVYNRLALEIELSALEGRIKDLLEEHAASLGRDVNGRAHRQVERARAAIQHAEEQLAAILAEAGALGELPRAIRGLCEPVVHVAAEAARTASLLRDQLADDRSVSLVLDALTRAAQSLTERYRIPARARRLDEPAAIGAGTVEIPFREWVLTRIETTVAPRVLASTREFAWRVEPLAQALGELERRVAFNAEVAAGELAVVEDESPTAVAALVREMIGLPLERHRELFRGYAADTEGWGEQLRRAVRDAVLDSLQELRGRVVDGEAGRLRHRMVRDVRGRRIARAVVELRGALRRSSVLLVRAMRDAMGERRIERLRATLGIASSRSSALELPRFAPATPVSSIPTLYRRLFAAEPADVVAGREPAVARALAGLESKGGGGLRTVAVVGTDGVGKSAFTTAIVRGHRWPKVRELDFDGPATVEAIDAFFDAASEGHLLVISGLHWMRALTPGGAAPLLRFTERVVQDGGRNAVLVRADRLVWEQCAQAAPLTQAFATIVSLEPLDEEALATAMLARHDVSGFAIVFGQGHTPQSGLEDAVLRATSLLSRPQTEFFRALHEASGGLLRDALRLWLASVREVDESSELVHLGRVPEPAIRGLRELSPDDALVVYQIARQGWMSAAVLGSVMRCDVATAHARLAGFADRGLLEPRHGVWRIAVHLRGAVDRLLRERGYVA